MALRKTAPKTKKIFTLYYQAHPEALNITTHIAMFLASSLQHHPFHIRAQRAVAAFDPDKLHITVRAHKTLSKSGFVRNHAIHRVRSALSDTLHKNGWNWDGTVQEVVKPKEGNRKLKRKLNLSGAYVVALKDLHTCLNATAEMLRVECDKVVSTMIFNRDNRPRKEIQQADVERLLKDASSSALRRGWRPVYADLLW